MSESEEVRLARIEEMLRGHFQRDEEKWERLAILEAKYAELKSFTDKLKGGYGTLAVLLGAAGTLGGMVAKFVPWGTSH